MGLVYPDKVREIAKVSREVPIYYIDESFIVEASEKMPIPKEDSSNTMGMLREYVGYRPFEEVVLVLQKNIIHFNGDKIPRTWFLDEKGIYHNTTLRENFDILKMDFDRDRKTFHFNLVVAILSLYPFSLKKATINLCTARTTYKGKTGKIKAKRSNVAIVSNKIYTSHNSPSKRIVASYPCTQVAGHRRFYRKNPENKGHDRNGNSVEGWTWVSPYKKGEGKETLEKIIKFIKNI